MLNSLKQTGQNMGGAINREWTDRAAGGRVLSGHSGDRLNFLQLS